MPDTKATALAEATILRSTDFLVGVDVVDTTMAAPLGLSGWLYSRILNDQNSTSLSNFVVKVSLTAANFDFSLPKSDGSDLRVYDETAGALVPIWVYDYDPVAQTATVYYKATLTNHLHTLYYGNVSASSVSSFTAVFLHGTGFDSSWGDLTTAVGGPTGEATRLAAHL
jgi:hypothetical protein